MEHDLLLLRSDGAARDGLAVDDRLPDQPVLLAPDGHGQRALLGHDHLAQPDAGPRHPLRLDVQPLLGGRHHAGLRHRVCRRGGRRGGSVLRPGGGSGRRLRDRLRPERAELRALVVPEDRVRPSSRRRLEARAGDRDRDDLVLELGAVERDEHLLGAEQVAAHADPAEVGAVGVDLPDAAEPFAATVDDLQPGEGRRGGVCCEHGRNS
ncbi:hypothetical protein GCM10009869_20910 [Amnibacterium kyonggiense]